MARFDIDDNPIVDDRDVFPFVMEIQSDLLWRFAERVCVPLACADAFPGMTQRFNPTVEVGERTVYLLFQRELGQPCATAGAHVLEIETALDMLLRGY